MKLREIAMEWWNNLSFTDKGNLMEGEFKHRHPQSLTGSEIVRLYLREHLIEKYDHQTIKQQIISAGIKKLEDFGNENVTSENIIQDKIFSAFFKRMLESNLGEDPVFDIVINELLEEIKLYSPEEYQQAKEFFLNNYFPSGNVSNEEKELWFNTTSWAQEAVDIMIKFKNN